MKCGKFILGSCSRMVLSLEMLLWVLRFLSQWVWAYCVNVMSCVLVSFLMYRSVRISLSCVDVMRVPLSRDWKIRSLVYLLI